MSSEELEGVICQEETTDTAFGTRHLPHAGSCCSGHVSQCWITGCYVGHLIQEPPTLLPWLYPSGDDARPKLCLSRNKGSFLLLFLLSLSLLGVQRRSMSIRGLSCCRSPGSLPAAPAASLTAPRPSAFQPWEEGGGPSETKPHRARCRTKPRPKPGQAISPHPDSSSFLFFFFLAGKDEHRGFFGPRSVHKVPLAEGCPHLFVQILPARMLPDVFKGAILMLRKEGKRRSDEPRHSKLLFTQKSSSLGIKKYIYSVFHRLIFLWITHKVRTWSVRV